jgi:hypothetical protein
MRIGTVNILLFSPINIQFKDKIRVLARQKIHLRHF